MKTLIQIEEAAILIATSVLSVYMGYSFWIFLALLLVPDVSMIGYLVNPRVGAWLYNFGHHRLTGIATALAGFYLGTPHLLFAGLILIGHTAMDRMLGYGLKYEDSFQHTHLGWVGKNRTEKA